MAFSIVRYNNQIERNGQPLWWGRANVDGLPYRGERLEYLREEEYEDRTIRVADYQNGFFDVTDPGENRNFLSIMECCANGWFELRFIDRFWRQTNEHYLEWTEYFLEDGTRTPSSAVVRQMEVERGSPNFASHPR